MSKGAWLMVTSSKGTLNKKMTAGAVMVALSGFVPDAINNVALADTATINATGTFSDGISLTAGTNLQFNTIVATDTSGTARLLPSGVGTSVVKAVFVGISQVPGTFAFNGAVTQSVNVSLISGITSKVVLPTQGDITIATLKFTGPFTATFTANKSTAAAIGAGNKALDINVGGQVIWSGATPLGAFSVPIKLSVAY
jgi:hypothetical protein